MRKYYIDNVRWLFILLLIPYHSLMAWNCWGEGNYIWFHDNRVFSSIIVFISPWYMSMLFVLAGMSARYSLRRRTNAAFVKERVHKLLLPLLAGIVTVVPVMTYFSDRFHNGYNGNFIEHYKIFFTRFTDLSGYDGGFTPGHLWFLLYLFLISMLCMGIIVLQKRQNPCFSCENIGILPLSLLGILPMCVSSLLAPGGKSIPSYLLFYLFGYYILSEEKVLEKVIGYRKVYMIGMLAADLCSVYLFLWAEEANGLFNLFVSYMAGWFGILAILGFAAKMFNQNNRVTRYLTARSFLIYIVHFVWVVMAQYYVGKVVSSDVLLLLITVAIAACMTFLCCEVLCAIKNRCTCL